MSVHVIGSFPSPIYRAFEEKEYARDFFERGIFQLRPLHHYHDIENISRQDKHEGEGRYVILKNRPVITLEQTTGKILSETSEFGPVYFGTGSINPHYILCFSGPQVDMEYLASHYGEHIIRIKRPKELISDIVSYLELSSNLPNEMWLECVQVRYDKGKTVSNLPEPASEERIRMSYGQKPSEFSSDCEYRIVLTLPLTNNKPPSCSIDRTFRAEFAFV